MMHQSPEDAFAMEPQDQIVLRVLVGVQQGAEMLLQPRPYVLGSGEDADIVLSERALAAQHLAIRLDGPAVTIEALEARVQHGDAWLESGSKAEIALPAAIRIGGTVILLADGAQDGAAFAIPEPLPEPGSEEPEPAAPETDETHELPEPAEADASPVAADGNTEPPRPEKRKRKATMVTAIGAFAVLALGGTALALFLGDGGTGAETAAETVTAPDPLAPIREVVADLGFTGLRVSDDPSVGPAIHGYLDTRADQAALRTALAEAGITATDRTRTGEQLLDAVGLTLGAVRWPEDGFRNHLQAQYLGGGVVEIDGFLGPSVDRDMLRRRILGDVPGVSSLRFERSDLRGWRDDLVDRIEAAGLSDWLTVTQRDGKLRVDGELSEGQVATWRAVGEAFVSESRGFPRISSQVVAVVPPELVPEPPPPMPEPEIVVPPEPPPPEVTITRPPLRLMGTVIGGTNNRWAVLADGRHVRLGDRLRSGAVVISIEPDRLEIELGGKTFTYRIREN